jgi:hypothetical protein
MRGCTSARGRQHLRVHPRPWCLPTALNAVVLLDFETTRVELRRGKTSSLEDVVVELDD